MPSISKNWPYSLLHPMASLPSMLLYIFLFVKEKQNAFLSNLSIFSPSQSSSVYPPNKDLGLLTRHKVFLILETLLWKIFASSPSLEPLYNSSYFIQWDEGFAFQSLV